MWGSLSIWEFRELFVRVLCLPFFISCRSFVGCKGTWSPTTTRPSFLRMGKPILRSHFLTTAGSFLWPANRSPELSCKICFLLGGKVLPKATQQIGNLLKGI